MNGYLKEGCSHNAQCAYITLCRGIKTAQKSPSGTRLVYLCVHGVWTKGFDKAYAVCEP